MRPLTIAIAVALAAACDAPTAPRQHADVRMDAAAYAASRTELESGVQIFDFRAVVTIDNTGAQPLQLARCGDDLIYSMERVDGRRSAFVWGWGCAAMPPRVLAPGETLTDTVDISGYSWAALGGELPLVEGTHRILYSGPGGLIRSRPFEVILLDE